MDSDNRVAAKNAWTLTISTNEEKDDEETKKKHEKRQKQ